MLHIKTIFGHIHTDTDTSAKTLSMNKGLRVDKGATKCCLLFLSSYIFSR